MTEKSIVLNKKQIHGEILGHPSSGVGRNVTKSHATARGLQLPICSLDQRWQQPIAVQQVLDGYGKPNETTCASLKMMQPSESHRFLNWISKWI